MSNPGFYGDIFSWKLRANSLPVACVELLVFDWLDMAYLAVETLVVHDPGK